MTIKASVLRRAGVAVTAILLAGGSLAACSSSDNGGGSGRRDHVLELDALG